MKIETRVYRLKDGKMKIFSNIKNTYSILDMDKPFKKWYRRNPYAKRINENWICQDYRIDQQRPQRNIYSGAYIKIISITEMEEKHLDKLIDELESKIDYPTVWDDGYNNYYEETIYCPNCGKRRKVLTSHTHCEFCGFEFDKAKKCPKCNGLNLKGSDECRLCGYVFRRKSFINNEDFEVKKDDEIEKINCPICNEKKSKYFDVCQNCGFVYRGKKLCPQCKSWVCENDKFCCHCGQEMLILVECDKCGKKNNVENNYCNGCGNRLR